MNDTPNLDAMDAADLDKYAADAGNPAPLRRYATVKAGAMRARASGRIKTATKLEATCERLYSWLPDNLKW